MNKVPPETHQEEIDLYELVLRIRKRWKLVLGTIFVFLVGAFVYILFAKPVYKVSFIISVNKISPYIIKKEIENINNLIKDRSYNKLSEKLLLDRSQSEKVANIYWKDIPNTNNLEIVLELYDPTVGMVFYKNLLDYLNKSPFIIENLREEKELINKNLQEIEDYIRDLENKKRIVDNVLSKRENIYFNPGELDVSLWNLKFQKRQMEANLQSLDNPIKIAVEPVIPTKPFKPKRTVILFFAFISSLFLGIFLALVLDWWSEVKRGHS